MVLVGGIQELVVNNCFEDLEKTLGLKSVCEFLLKAEVKKKKEE